MVSALEKLFSVRCFQDVFGLLQRLSQKCWVEFVGRSWLWGSDRLPLSNVGI